MTPDPTLHPTAQRSPQTRMKAETSQVSTGPSLGPNFPYYIFSIDETCVKCLIKNKKKTQTFT